MLIAKKSERAKMLVSRYLRRAHVLYLQSLAVDGKVEDTASSQAVEKEERKNRLRDRRRSIFVSSSNTEEIRKQLTSKVLYSRFVHTKRVFGGRALRKPR